MKSEILYVELKQGAWIGFGQYSKTGQTIYFDGKILKKAQGIISNHFDLISGEEYWISRVKKNGFDRHWAGSGKIYIDKEVIEQYLEIIGSSLLPKNKFIITELNNTPNKSLSEEIENSKLSE